MKSDTRRFGFQQALKWAFVLNWGQRGVMTIVTVVLASLLGPEAFGLLAMALVVIAFLEILLDGGFAAAIIQREELEDGHLDTAFWLTLATSTVLCGVIIGLSQRWADLNSTPELAGVLVALAALVPIKGLTTVQEAIVKRRMDFKGLAIRANIAAVLGGAVGVTMAVFGFGVWALVAQQLTFRTVSLLLLWRISGWLPGFNISFRYLSDLFGFTAGVFVNQLGVYLYRRSDALLMGLFFGPIATGIMRLADRLVETLQQLLTKPGHAISLAHMSRYQQDPMAFREAMAKVIRALTLLSVPCLAIAALVAAPVVELIGAEWQPAVMAIRLLCVAGMLNTFTLFVGPSMQAVGKAHHQATLTWITAIVSVGAFCAVAVLYRDARLEVQVLMIALARCCVSLVAAPIKMFVIARMTGITWREYAGAIRAPMAAATAAVLTGLPAVSVCGALQIHAAVEFLVVGFVTATAACLTLYRLEPVAQRMLVQSRDSARTFLMRRMRSEVPNA